MCYSVLSYLNVMLLKSHSAAPIFCSALLLWTLTIDCLRCLCLVEENKDLRRGRHAHNSKLWASVNLDGSSSVSVIRESTDDLYPLGEVLGYLSGSR